MFAPASASIGNVLGRFVREFKAFSGLTPAAYLDANSKPHQDVGFLQDAHPALG
jgi:hypothetical protein